MGQKLKGTLHEDQHTFFYHISLISFYNDKCLRKNLWRKSKHIFCSVVFFPPETRALYETMLRNIVERGRARMTI